MTAYYNENDPYAAEWLRNLIRNNLIAPGDVDERSIIEVKPSDLSVYVQCHFFAGIGVWSYALRRAGWPDDRPVWTGSCPCQPFSQAGAGKGLADERHLWPHWFHLIKECGPAIILGEQVASKDGLRWLDLVQADLEGENYACAAVDTCSAGVGAPHIRQRLRVAAQRLDYTDGARHQWQESKPESTDGNETWLRLPRSGCGSDELEHSQRHRSQRRISGRAHPERQTGNGAPRPNSSVGNMANPDGRVTRQAGPGRIQRRRQHRQQPQDCGPDKRMADTASQQRNAGRIRTARQQSCQIVGSARRGAASFIPKNQSCSAFIDRDGRTGPINGFWRDADWLLCRDGKWRPVEPGTFPLAHGASARMGRLRAYGNAVDAEATTLFVEAVMECLP